MGVSTNAILFYGYCWSEEGSTIFEFVDGARSDDDWPEMLLRRRGGVSPWDAYYGGSDSETRPSSIAAAHVAMKYEDKRRAEDAWCEAHRAELDAWRKARQAVEAEFAVEVCSHCSGDYRMPYLAAKGALTLAYRGSPKEITSLAVDPAWSVALEKFIAELKVTLPDGQDKPHWWLVSYWG